MAPQSWCSLLQFDDRYGPILLGRVTLGVFAVVGALIALAEWGILPRETLVVGVPALVAAILLDTFLYNEFLISTGSWIWLGIYAFVYVQAVVVSAVAHLLRPYWGSLPPLNG